jgi:hypothetical protein
MSSASLRLEILLFNRYPDNIGCVAHLGFRKEAGVKKTKDELTNGHAHGFAGRVEVLGRDTMRALRRLRAKLAGPATDGTDLRDLRVVLAHPRDLCVAELAKPLLVVVDRPDGRGRLRKPEREIRVVPGELVQMLGREAANLVGNQLRASD